MLCEHRPPQSSVSAAFWINPGFQEVFLAQWKQGENVFYFHSKIYKLQVKKKVTVLLLISKYLMET